jgi:hypothetical protein
VACLVVALSVLSAIASAPIPGRASAEAEPEPSLFGGAASGISVTRVVWDIEEANPAYVGGMSVTVDFAGYYVGLIYIAVKNADGEVIHSETIFDRVSTPATKVYEIPFEPPLAAAEISFITVVSLSVPAPVFPFPRTVYLSPDGGLDTTWVLGRPLTPKDLQKLGNSDDLYYVTKREWHEDFAGCEYLEFSFPDIPKGAKVTDALLKFEWQPERTSEGSGARLRIWNGSGWVTYKLPVPAAGADSIVTVDLKGLCGIDTAGEVNALKVRFQAKKVGVTRHDWVQLQVTYTI